MLPLGKCQSDSTQKQKNMKNANINRFSPLEQEDIFPKGGGDPKRDRKPTHKAAEMEEQSKQKKSKQPAGQSGYPSSQTQ